MKDIFLKKRIILLITTLVVFNTVLIFNFFYFKDANSKVEPKCYNNDKIYSFFKPVLLSEEIKCDGCQPVFLGKTLFEYYGEDANCWEKLVTEQAECYRKYPYGGVGTVVIGDDLVISPSYGLYFNGNDGQGYHWIMSGTSTEPIGNAIGFKKSSTNTDVYFGNHIIVNGDVSLESVSLLGITINTPKNYFQIKDVGEDYWSKEIKYMDFNNGGIKILEEGVCGGCRIDGVIKCESGNVGKNYKFLLSSLNILGKIKTLKDSEIRLSINSRPVCEKVCSYITRDKYETVKNYFDIYDSRVEEFEGYECGGTLSSCNGNFCNPQPQYYHYRTVDYEVEGVGCGGSDPHNVFGPFKPYAPKTVTGTVKKCLGSCKSCCGDPDLGKYPLCN